MFNRGVFADHRVSHHGLGADSAAPLDDRSVQAGTVADRRRLFFIGDHAAVVDDPGSPDLRGAADVGSDDPTRVLDHRGLVDDRPVAGRFDDVLFQQALVVDPKILIVEALDQLVQHRRIQLGKRPHADRAGFDPRRQRQVAAVERLFTAGHTVGADDAGMRCDQGAGDQADAVDQCFVSDLTILECRVEHSGWQSHLGLEFRRCPGEVTQDHLAQEVVAPDMVRGKVASDLDRRPVRCPVPLRNELIDLVAGESPGGDAQHQADLVLDPFADRGQRVEQLGLLHRLSNRLEQAMRVVSGHDPRGVREVRRRTGFLFIRL